MNYRQFAKVITFVMCSAASTIIANESEFQEENNKREIEEGEMLSDVEANLRVPRRSYQPAHEWHAERKRRCASANIHEDI